MPLVYHALLGDWQHRAQFFAISAQIMRNILVDAARSRGRTNREAK